MNWFKRLQKQAQSLDLSLSSVLTLLAQASTSPDLPGQNYLLQGPEVSEMQRIRGLNQEAYILKEIANRFNVMFDQIAEKLEDDVADREIDENEVQENIGEYAAMYASEFSFGDNKNEIHSFLNFLDDGDRINLYQNSINRKLPVFIPLTSRSDYFTGTPQEAEAAFKPVLDELSKLLEEYDVQYDPKHLLNGYIEALQKGNEDEFFEELAKYTDAIMVQYIDRSDRSLYMTDKKWFPSWIDKKVLIGELDDLDNQKSDWYEQENKDSLRDSAIESIQERNSDDYREAKRELQHKYGFDVIDLLSTEYLVPEEGDQPDEDYRWTLSLNSLLDIVNDFREHYYSIKGSQETEAIINVYSATILRLAELNDDLKLIFGQDLANVSIAPEKLEESLLFAAENEIDIPQELQTEDLKELIELMKLKQTQQEEYHKMIEPGKGQLTEEELQKAKELGISRSPFPHQYSLTRQPYPGTGWFKPRGKRWEPFTISIAPNVENIPQDLIEEMSLHKVPTVNGQKALGWVGGFADYSRKNLFVTEMQSDVMQRTVHMRDPKKAKEQKERELANIDKELNSLATNRQNAKSPFQQISETVQRVQQENASMLATDPKFQKNQQLLTRLQSQLPHASQQIDTSKIDTQIASLQERHKMMEAALAKDRDFKTEGGYFKDFGKWHDYRSKVENTFKDWVPIFFNTCVREAKRRGFVKIFLISAESLMQLWAQFARPQTKQLFERVYDATAQRYSAKPVEMSGNKWFEIDLQNPQLLVAQRRNSVEGWFKKATKTAETNWLIQAPDGRFVWQHHIDTFFNAMEKELLSEEDSGIGDYSKNIARKEIFDLWLDTVPQELKVAGGLNRQFKRQVQSYLEQTREFDPFEGEFEGEFEDDEPDVVVPPPEELDAQWGF